jgi:Domain of unknown function (DUF4062)
MAAKPIEVFISSTCEDLVDLRSELTATLKQHGFRVRISEDSKSGFMVEPYVDAIETCLVNVEASDVVIVVLDRRYGRPLPPTYPVHGGRSATHAEVATAIKSKPVFYFIREAALADFYARRRDVDHNMTWVETSDPGAAKLWFKWVDELFSLPSHATRSNWYDAFKTSVQLRELVLDRLTSRFPQHAGLEAMQPDRLVRLTFYRHDWELDGIAGYFENLGVGAALNVLHGIKSTADNEWRTRYYRGGLREGERLIEHNQSLFGYQTPSGVPPSEVMLACEYENRFGNRYLVLVKKKGEEFYVWQPLGNFGRWLQKV